MGSLTPKRGAYTVCVCPLVYVSNPSSMSFVAEPEEVQFTDYSVGETYEVQSM